MEKLNITYLMKKDGYDTAENFIELPIDEIKFENTTAGYDKKWVIIKMALTAIASLQGGTLAGFKTEGECWDC